MVGSLYSICGMWTVYLYCFLFLIMQKSLENIYHPNIVTKGFPRLKKIYCCIQVCLKSIFYQSKLILKRQKIVKNYLLIKIPYSKSFIESRKLIFIDIASFMQYFFLYYHDNYHFESESFMKSSVLHWYNKELTLLLVL